MRGGGQRATKRDCLARSRRRPSGDGHDPEGLSPCSACGRGSTVPC